MIFNRAWFPSALKKCVLSVILLGGIFQQALAQGFPDRAVRFVVPFSAGGSTDVTARIVGEAMSHYLGQPVVAENRPGAAGAIGAGAVAKALPDGYTVLVGGVGPIMVLPALDAKLAYRPQRDLEAIGQITNNDYGVVVKTDSALQTMADFVREVKGRPGQLSYMTTGVGGPLHVGMEYFAVKQGLALNHVPYQGESQAAPDLLSGRLDVAVMSLTVAGPLIKAGKVRMLALLNAQRSALLPEVPTIGEAGFRGHEIPVWLGLFVPRNTPPQAIATLSAAMQKAMAQSDVQQKLLGQGAEPVLASREKYMEFLGQESVRWKTQVKAAGILR